LEVGVIKDCYASAESCAFRIVKGDDAWVVFVGLEFNNDEMNWIPMLMWFYTEDAAFKRIQNLGPLFGNEHENIKVIHGDLTKTRRLEYPAEQYKSEGAVDIEADRVWKQ
jgi:hypothetical protein